MNSELDSLWDIEQVQLSVLSVRYSPIILPCATDEPCCCIQDTLQFIGDGLQSSREHDVT